MNCNPSLWISYSDKNGKVFLMAVISQNLELTDKII